MKAIPIKSLLAAVLLLAASGLSAEALEDTTSHYTAPADAPHYDDPDEHSNFSSGAPSTEYPGNSTRSQYYLGNDNAAGPTTYSSQSGSLSYGFTGSGGDVGGTTYGPRSHY